MLVMGMIFTNPRNVTQGRYFQPARFKARVNRNSALRSIFGA